MRSLPIAEIRSDFKAAMESVHCAVVTAPTGSGKSTRLPQYLLADGKLNGRILVLQPRRIAARMLAERVADELGTRPGEQIGFQTRYENCQSAETRVLFITAGLLLRILLANPNLDGVDAILFDEFHERGIDTDIGLALARRLQRGERPDLRLVVTSATLAAEPVAAYLGNCPHLHAEGRLFPVEISYQKKAAQKPVWELAAKAAGEILQREGEGDLLIFMPGVYEIRKTIEALGGGIKAIPLYGDLPPEKQRQAFESGPRRKVIVATNVAETSLTIPGVRHVIDSGLARMSRHDAGRGFNLLETVPIARDSADQRAGRAGREAPGTCHRLWRLVDQHRKPSRTAPEIERLDLAETILPLKRLGVRDLRAFEWFEAPPEKPLEHAERLLHFLGALDSSGKITELGRELTRFPAHPRLALLLHSAGQAGCFPQAALAAALLSERPVGSRGSSATSRRKRQKEGAHEALYQSDFEVLINGMEELRAGKFNAGIADRFGINVAAARQVWRAAEHFMKLGAKRKLKVGKGKGAPDALTRCLLRAFPDRLARRRDKGSLVCELSNGRRGELARESVVRDESLLVACDVREIGGGGKKTKTILSLAAGISDEWLMQDFPDAWEETDEIIWHERDKRVLRHRRLACLGVTLDESSETDVPAAEAAAILAERVVAGKLRLEGWDKHVESWISRVRWTAQQFPRRELTTYDETDRALIIEEICTGATCYRDIRTKACLDHVRHALSWEDIQFVESMAPVVVNLPSGRRMKITYEAGKPPKGRARIQDFYGLEETPKLGGGRVPMLLEILAPNMQTVQITDNLARFWKEIYPRAKSELSRRYPKHEWR